MDKKLELRRMWYAALAPATLLIIVWMIWLWEWNFDINLQFLGTYPRKFSGLGGMISQPLVHADIKHLLSNSVPLLILSWCLFFFYKDLGYAVFPILWVFSGLLTWFIGREAWHIGASGVVYALIFFLFFSGVFRRHKPLMAISILVVFLYGSAVWYMFPVVELIKERNISWEGHLSGAICGFLCACAVRKYGPQKPIEEEEEEEEEGDTLI